MIPVMLTTTQAELLKQLVEKEGARLKDRYVSTESISGRMAVLSTQDDINHIVMQIDKGNEAIKRGVLNACLN